MYVHCHASLAFSSFILWEYSKSTSSYQNPSTYHCQLHPCCYTVDLDNSLCIKITYDLYWLFLHLLIIPNHGQTLFSSMKLDFLWVPFVRAYVIDICLSIPGFHHMDYCPPCFPMFLQMSESTNCHSHHQLWFSLRLEDLFGITKFNVI